jgi:hypothetical protein
MMFRVNKLEILNWGELGEYVLAAVLVTIVIWLFYGIFCLVATPLQSSNFLRRIGRGTMNKKIMVYVGVLILVIIAMVLIVLLVWMIERGLNRAIAC